MKHTVILFAEVEIEDEGFLTDCVQEEMAAGRLQNLRPVTLGEIKSATWDTYLLPRLNHINNFEGRMLELAIARETKDQEPPCSSPSETSESTSSTSTSSMDPDLPSALPTPPN